MKTLIAILALFMPLTASALTAESLVFSLAWDDPNPADRGVTSYEIWDKVSGSWKLVATIPAPEGATPKVDVRWELPKDLTSGVHIFVVKAVNVHGPSIPTAGSYAVLPAIPGGIGKLRVIFEGTAK